MSRQANPPEAEPNDFMEALKRALIRHRLPKVLLSALCIGLLVVIWGSFSPGYPVVGALLWAMGFCASGMLLGFLFAIPRTPPAVTAAANAAAKAATNAVAGTRQSAGGNDNNDSPSAASTAQPMGTVPNEINSNLVEVSDWLTKIIIGVGLVELKRLPQAAESVADFIAPSLGTPLSMYAPIAGSIILYFSVLGFLIGYLMTRVYLSVMIKLADNLVRDPDKVRLASGRAVDVGELSRLQQSALEDLQDQVARMAVGAPDNAEAKAAVTRRVLWVDDNPNNNMLLIEHLSQMGLATKQVLDTRSALEALKMHSYDIVISDMARLERGMSVENAGIQLAREIRESDTELPIVIYCSKRMLARYGDEATREGARLVTSSATTLLGAVARILGSAAVPADIETKARSVDDNYNAVAQAAVAATAETAQASSVSAQVRGGEANTGAQGEGAPSPTEGPRK